jgi:AraC-like DNA-binding protein
LVASQLKDAPAPTVCVGLVHGLIDVATGFGAERAALLAHAAVDEAQLADQDGRLPLSQYQALMDSAKHLTGRSALPLLYGERVDMSVFSVVGLLFQACTTTAEGLEQINRYGRLVVEVDTGEGSRFQMVRSDDALWLVDTRSDPNAFPELTETTFARFIGMTGRAGVNGIVKEIHVTHPLPEHFSEYSRLCDGPVLFDREWNAMRLDEELLVRPIARQPRYAFGILSQHIEALMERLDASRTVRGRVEALLMRRLHTGHLQVAGVARELGISRQTLFRKLKAEGSTYVEVLDTLRRTVSQHYLAAGKTTVQETAYLVGFSEPSAFSRAYKRWTGVSPRAVRKGQGSP